MNKQSEYLSKKKKYFIDCIEYQIKKRVNILQKIELTKRKHERLSKDISVLKKEISEISSTISENAFETLQNTTSNDTECSQIPECQTTLPVKIEEKINTDDVVIKSERQLLFDVKSKKKLKSTIIKLFKRIIGKKITINKCRRLNKMTCQIKLNSHLDPNEKVILVEDNGNKITVKIINSSHTVLPTKKYRQYYHIDYNLADAKVESSINEDSNRNEPETNETENKDGTMIVLNPIACSNVSDEDKFYISRLGNELINEYFYLISFEPFTICPIFGDVVINRDVYESLKPVVFNTMKNKEPHTIPCIHIVPEKELNDIEKELEVSLQNMVGINHKPEHHPMSISERDSSDNSDLIDLTSINNDSEAFETEELNNHLENSNDNTSNIHNNSILKSYLEKPTNEDFVRTQIMSSGILPSVQIREHIKMGSDYRTEPLVQDKETVFCNSISLDSDDDMEEIS